MKPVLIVLLMASAIAQSQIEKDDLTISADTCTKYASARLVSTFLNEREESAVTRSDGTQVALFRDMLDARALSCVANPKVPESARQAWAKAWAERIRLRHELDRQEMIK